MEYSFLRYFLFFSYVIQRPILPQISLITQRECSKLHYFADKRQLPHSGDNAVHVYTTKLWGNMLIHSLLFPYMWTANSPADSADYAEGMQQAALFRRQKTATS